MDADFSCLIIAGEKSGEEHAKEFLSSLVDEFPNIDLFGVGGAFFQEKGVNLLYHLNDFSSMGFSEVIKKIPFYLKARKKIIREVEKRKTKYAILVDFQSFNLSLAKKLEKQGVKVLYYVAPQAWAWKAWRAEEIKKCVYELFCILPFEKKWFEKKGVRKVTTLQHPVYLELKNKKLLEEKNEILILPGSRKSEIKYLMPHFIESLNLIKNKFPDSVFSIVESSSVDSKIFEYYLKDFNLIKRYRDTEIDLALSKAKVAIAASGTVTLRCAIMKVPTVVCYRVSMLNEYIYNNFIDYRGFVSLPNVILNEEIFPELLGEDCHSYKIAKKVFTLLSSQKDYERHFEKLFLELKRGDESGTKRILDIFKNEFLT